MVAKTRMAAFSTVGLEKHAKDPVHLAGRDAAVDSEEGNFVVKCRHAAVYIAAWLIAVLNGKGLPITSETDRVRVQEGKLRELNEISGIKIARSEDTSRSWHIRFVSRRRISSNSFGLSFVSYLVTRKKF